VTLLLLRATSRSQPWRTSRVAIHVAAALATSVAFSVVSGTLGYALALERPDRSLIEVIGASVLDWLPFQPLLYVGVLAIGLALETARRQRAVELGRARLEVQLAQAQLAVLSAQLQPHFLFNTLNAAVTLARQGDTAATARVLVLLGDLLRRLLGRDAPHEIPLSEELGLLETYLEIQQVRFGDRLRVGWDIDDGVRAALVPQLVLQPVVENALEHGIARRARGGRIDIRAVRVGDAVRLTVRDDGGGLASDFAIEAGRGIGLRNTLERVRRLYGGDGDVRLARVGGDGDDAHTVTEVIVPFHTIEAARA